MAIMIEDLPLTLRFSMDINKLRGGCCMRKCWRYSLGGEGDDSLERSC